MNTQDLLSTCQKEFPSLDWEISYSDKNSSGVIARIDRFVVSVDIWHMHNSAMACVTVGKLSSLELFRSTNKKGTTLEQALTELRGALERFVKAFSEAIQR